MEIGTGLRVEYKNKNDALKKHPVQQIFKIS
jgi:hypothetical protein